MSKPDVNDKRSYADGLKAAYEAACRIVDRDGELGMDDFGIIENILAELAKLAGVP